MLLNKLLKVIFFRLFKKHPEYTKFFSKYGSCPDEILKSQCFIDKHAIKLLMGTISDFVKKVEDPCAAERMMKKIGKKHIPLCVKCEHFQVRFKNDDFS